MYNLDSKFKTYSRIKDLKIIRGKKKLFQLFI